MIAEKLLSRLQKVKPKGSGAWLACCPAHDDKNPSLGVTEKDDRVLVHCFSQECSPYEIVSAVGLEITDLFPEKIPVEGNKPIKKRRFPEGLVMKAVDREMVIVEVFLSAVGRGLTIPGHAQEMARQASLRIRAARAYT